MTTTAQLPLSPAWSAEFTFRPLAGATASPNSQHISVTVSSSRSPLASGASSESQIDTPQTSGSSSTIPFTPPLTEEIGSQSLAPTGSDNFDSKLEAAIKQGRTIATVIDDRLAVECSHEPKPTNDTLARLRKVAEEGRNYKSLTSKTIAFLGNSGEGKSSVINALLDYPELAKTSDIGSACTSVVTEFKQKSAQQESFIHLEVEFLTDSGIQELLKELLWDFRKPLLGAHDRDTLSAKDLDAFEKASGIAWSSLNAAFGHKDSFSQDFLRNTSAGAEEAILAKLVEWSHEITWPDDATDGVWHSTANDIDECHDRLELFSMDQFWPFTKIIRIFLDSDILRKGIVLADLPGLHDTNLARVSAAQTYLMRCDFIVIVANISRALSNASLESSMYEAMQQLFPYDWSDRGGKSFKLAVVCTRSDEINVKANRKAFLDVDEKVSKATMDAITEGMRKAKQAGDKEKEKKFKRQEKLLLRTARSEYVKRGLKQSYAAKVPQSSLPVFCVSSTLYDKGAEENDSELVKASEIPRLRQFCASVGAEAKLSDTKSYLDTDLPSLLTSAIIWAQNADRVGEEEEACSNRKTLYKSFEEMKSAIINALSNLEPEFREATQSIIDYFDHRSEHWKAEADKRALTWHNWHHASYNAWCRHDGIHTTPARGYANWNAELIWKMRAELEVPWDMFNEEIPELMAKFLNVVRTAITQFQRTCETDMLPSTFKDALRLRGQATDEIVARKQSELEREIGTVRHKAFEGTGASYIVREMQGGYRRACRESGPGYSARQKAIVDGHIARQDIFPNIAQSILADMRSIRANVLNKLAAQVRDLLASMLSDLESATKRRKKPVTRIESARLRRMIILFGTLRNDLSDITKDLPMLEAKEW